MSKLWADGGEVRAWTDQDGPDVGPEPAAPIWTHGLALGWVAFLVPLVAFSCGILTSALETACPSLPRWVSWTTTGTLVALVPALSGLSVRRTFGAEWSMYAAILGLFTTAPDISWLGGWGVFEVSGFGILGIWSVLSLRRCRAVEAAALVDPWDAALALEVARQTNGLPAW